MKAKSLTLEKKLSFVINFWNYVMLFAIENNCKQYFLITKIGYKEPTFLLIEFCDLLFNACKCVHVKLKSIYSINNYIYLDQNFGEVC